MILTAAATLQPFVESFRSMALTPSRLLPVLLGIVSNSLWTHLLCDGRDLRAALAAVLAALTVCEPPMASIGCTMSGIPALRRRGPFEALQCGCDAFGGRD